MAELLADVLAVRVDVRHVVVLSRLKRHGTRRPGRIAAPPLVMQERAEFQRVVDLPGPFDRQTVPIARRLFPRVRPGRRVRELIMLEPGVEPQTILLDRAADVARLVAHLPEVEAGLSVGTVAVHFDRLALETIGLPVRGEVSLVLVRARFGHDIHHTAGRRLPFGRCSERNGVDLFDAVDVRALPGVARTDVIDHDAVVHIGGLVGGGAHDLNLLVVRARAAGRHSRRRLHVVGDRCADDRQILDHLASRRRRNRGAARIDHRALARHRDRFGHGAELQRDVALDGRPRDDA